MTESSQIKTDSSDGMSIATDVIEGVEQWETTSPRRKSSSSS